MITQQQVEDWLKIRKENVMDAKLPKSWLLQDEINNLLGLSKDCFEGDGIPVMNLGRGDTLKLLLAIIKLKKKEMGQ